MRARAGWIAALLLPAALAATAAAQPQLTATIDRTDVVVNEPFLVTIRAQGNRVAEPVIPHSPDIRFNRDPAYRTNSTSVQIVNGKATSVEIRQRSYRAWALRPGTLTMPRIEVRIDGQTFLTDELQINAREPSAAAEPPPVQQRPHSPGAGGMGGLRQPSLDDVIRIETEVDRKRVYLGEQVVLTLRILELAMPGATAVYNGRSIPLPNTEGFYSGPLEENRGQDRRDGLLYRVNEYRQHLYPTREGTLTIGEWPWEGTVRGYTGRGIETKEHRIVAKPIDVEVRPLPAAPENFSGAVGSFSVRVSVRDAEVTQGVPTVLTVQVEGQGNPDAINAPPLPEIPWAHVGVPESQVERGTTGQGGRVMKTFTYALTPLEAGDQEVPALVFVYFEPRLNNFRAETTRPVPMRVLPSKDAGQLVAVGGTQRAATGVEVLGADLLPPIADAGPLAPTRSGRALNTLAGLLPPAACLAFLGFLRRQRRLANDPKYARERAAWSRTQKRLAHLEDAEDPVEALFRALVDYVADKFHVESSGMTAPDVRALLRERGVDDALTEMLVRILRTCERARYAATRLEPEERRALVASGGEALDQLDAYIRRERGR